jgi:hypothetical protein
VRHLLPLLLGSEPGLKQENSMVQAQEQSLVKQVRLVLQSEFRLKLEHPLQMNESVDCMQRNQSIWGKPWVHPVWGDQEQ